MINHQYRQHYHMSTYQDSKLKQYPSVQYAVRNYIFHMLFFPLILENIKNAEQLTGSVFCVIR